LLFPFDTCKFRIKHPGGILLRFSLQHSTDTLGRLTLITTSLFGFSLLLLVGCAGYQTPAPAAAAAISVSASSFNFKTVVLGHTFTQTLHITNTGKAPLRITGFALSDKQFAIAGPSVPRVIFPNLSSAYELSFTPSVAGTAAASLKIVSDALNTAVSVSLTGVGEKVQATTQVSPAVVDFGNLTVQSTATKNVTLRNSGDVNITINGVTVIGSGFGASNLAPGFLLTPNSSVTFQVWFHPTVKCSASGTVSILSANLSSPATTSLSGSGTSSTSTPSPESCSAHRASCLGHQQQPYGRLSCLSFVFFRNRFSAHYLCAAHLSSIRR
jgi:hypothetical protein